jgi:hypothetical protein
LRQIWIEDKDIVSESIPCRITFLPAFNAGQCCADTFEDRLAITAVIGAVLLMEIMAWTAAQAGKPLSLPTNTPARGRHQSPQLGLLLSTPSPQQRL